ncbi:MAG: hypothetical protein ACYCTE_12160 [Acidimicrobiales bacterium]
MKNRRNVISTASAPAATSARQIGVIGPFPGTTKLRQSYHLGDNIRAKVLAASPQGSRAQTSVGGACVDSGLVKERNLRWAGIWNNGRTSSVVPDAVCSLHKGVVEFQDDVRAGAIWHSIAMGRKPRKNDVYVARRGLVKDQGYEILPGLAPVGRDELLDRPSRLLLTNPSTWVVFERREIDPVAAIVVFSDGFRCTRSDPEFPLALRWAMTPHLFDKSVTS